MTALLTFGQKLRRMAAMARLEFDQVRRDRPSLSLMLALPVVQLALFGYAVQPLPRDVPVAIARTGGGAALIEGLERGGIFKVVADQLPRDGARAAVLDRRAVIGLEIAASNDGDDDDLRPALRVIVDDSDAALAAPALAELERRALRQRAGTDAPRVAIERLYNRDERVTWSLMPALSGVIIMISGLMLGALAFVRERERGTLDFLLSSPLRVDEALVGKLAPYVVVTLIQTVAVIGLAMVLFDLPWRGSAFALILAAFLSSIAHLSLGLTISIAARVQAQAIQGAVMVYLPSMLLSGFLYPFSNMPWPARLLGEAFPLTHFIRAAREALLRGGDFASVLALAAPLALQAIVFLSLAWIVARRKF